MKTSIFQVVSLGALWLVSAGAHAFCIDTGIVALGANDVRVSGATCVVEPPATSCDMNGMQAGAPTHGQLTALVSPGGMVTSIWVGWTRNGPTSTAEYACNLDPTSLAGQGWVHIFSGQPGVPKSFLNLPDCQVVTSC